MELLSFLALSPAILILVLLLAKVSLRKAAPITFVYTALLAYFVWRMNTDALVGSMFRGVLVGLDIVLIVFGAILFLEFLKEQEIMDSIKYYLTTISEDKRVQIIILIWFFGSFLEGVAGFGTPAAIIAPLLVGIGFSSVKSVALALIGNTSAVVFGAVGTPIRVGFESVDATGVASEAALMNIFVGSFVPTLLILVFLYGKEEWWSSFKETLPLSLIAGPLIMVPTYAATFIGPEFPSLLGPLIGFFLFLAVLKISLFVPHQKRTIMDDEKELVGEPAFSVFQSALPYLLLVMSLGIGRVILGSTSIELPGGLSHSLNFFNPGLFFILTILVCTQIYSVKKSSLSNALSNSTGMIVTPFIVILFITGFVEILLNTDSNMSGLATMVDVFTQSIPASVLVSLSPVLGAFGSFMTGSATVSNILFGPFLETAAVETGSATKTVLGGQVVGAGIGNMFALTNIVAAQAAVKIEGEETRIIRMVLPSAVVMCVLALVAMFFF